MAKKSVVNRNIKRALMVEKFKSKRLSIKNTWLKDPSAKNREAAFFILQKMPRDSSAVRVRNRCALVGRPRGVYRRFGISRTILREMAMSGEVPGVMKSSW